MKESNAAIRSLVNTIASLQKDVRSQARASQAAYRSVELGDHPIRYYDSTGEIGSITTGPNGIELLPVTGAVPSTPTSPDAIGVQGGIVVRWDGTFLESNWLSTTSHVELHKSTDDGFVANDTTLVDTYTSYYGGEKMVSATPLDGELWFRLVTVDRAGNRSAPSDTDSATALATYVGSDGEAPATSPAAVVRGGLGAIFVSWVPINNFDPVTYDVHISTIDGFVPNGTTKVGETPGSTMVIRKLPNGDPLINATIYYVRIVARDADDSAAPGAQGGGSLVQVTGDDIAVNYVYAGNILADQIEGGTILSEITVAGLIKTAISGGRVEIGPFGVRVYDSNGVDVMVDLGGAINTFRGSVDAIDIRIRNGLELYGQNNKFASNSIVTLQTGQSGSAAAPTLVTKYATSDLLSNYRRGYWYLSGYWQNTAGTSKGGVANEYGGDGLLLKDTDKFYTLGGFTSVLSDGSTVRKYNRPNKYTRFITAGVEKAAFLCDYVAPGSAPGAFSETSVVVVDDSALTNTGSVAPTMVARYSPHLWSYVRSYGLGRVFGPPGGPSSGRETLVAYGSLDPGASDALELKLLQLSGSTMIVNYAPANINFATYRVNSSEVLRSVHYGNTWGMGMTGSSGAGDVWLIQTSHQNLVLSADGTVRHSAYEWPVVPADNSVNFATGDITTNVCNEFGTVNFGGNIDAASTQKITWYSNWMWSTAPATTDRIWAQFAWRGHSSKSPEWLTTPSPMSLQFTPLKRSLVTLTVPALPPPEAGVGAARDINKDVYGWVLYLGKGTSSPSNANMFREVALSPAGDPTAVTAIDLAAFPGLSGANPLASTTGFPNLSPAKIVSSASSGGVPLLSIDGDGNIQAKNVSLSEVLTQAKAGINKHVTTPSNPAAGFVAGPYFKSDNNMYFKTSAGTERQITGDITTYTPSTSGVTNPVVSGRWIRDSSGVIFVRALITLGPATGAITGHVQIGLPFTLAWDFGFTATLQDITGSNYRAGCLASGTVVNVYYLNGANNSRQDVLAAGSPFVWAPGDKIEVNGCFIP